MLDKTGNKWFIKGLYIRKDEIIERLNQKLKKYDLTCLCNVLVAESIDEAKSEASKTSRTMNQALLPGLLLVV
jgi:hydroxymethylpyrimidine/phosphomethylpyrimidine kinase